MGGNVLYVDELTSALPQGLSVEDSSLFTDNFIRQWATKQLMVSRAELNLSDQQKDVSRQLEEYRQSLLIYLYQTEWVRQQMDTLVKDDEINAYHGEHAKDFDLQEDIVRALFIKVNVNDPEVDNLRKWIRKDNDTELRSVLEGYCAQHALSMHLNDQQWIPLEKLIGQLPASSGMNASQARNSTFIDVADSTARYIIDIKEMKQKNEKAPVDYVRQDIISVILNRRKLNMMRKLERDIYDQAVAKGQLKVVER
ncbi:MAG: hypothetical protein K9J06_03940 [Flavobacteriales bacterium]|nr:hypothetical protein [Flavobacteriales bacterium]